MEIDTELERLISLEISKEINKDILLKLMPDLLKSINRRLVIESILNPSIKIKRISDIKDIL